MKRKRPAEERPQIAEEKEEGEEEEKEEQNEQEQQKRKKGKTETQAVEAPKPPSRPPPPPQDTKAAGEADKAVQEPKPAEASQEQKADHVVDTEKRVKRPAMHMAIGPNDLYVTTKTPWHAYLRRALHLLQPPLYESKKQPTKDKRKKAASASSSSSSSTTDANVRVFAMGAAVPIALQVIDKILATMLTDVRIVNVETGSSILIDDVSTKDDPEHRLNSTLCVTLARQA